MKDKIYSKLATKSLMNLSIFMLLQRCIALIFFGNLYGKMAIFRNLNKDVLYGILFVLFVTFLFGEAREYKRLDNSQRMSGNVMFMVSSSVAGVKLALMFVLLLFTINDGMEIMAAIVLIYFFGATALVVLELIGNTCAFIGMKNMTEYINGVNVNRTQMIYYIASCAISIVCNLMALTTMRNQIEKRFDLLLVIPSVLIIIGFVWLILDIKKNNEE